MTITPEEIARRLRGFTQRWSGHRSLGTDVAAALGQRIHWMLPCLLDHFEAQDKRIAELERQRDGLHIARAEAEDEASALRVKVDKLERELALLRKGAHLAEQMVERAARALCAHNSTYDPDELDRYEMPMWSHWSRMASAALDAALPQWQPIETAPNGDQILAFIPNHYRGVRALLEGKGRIIVATWLDWKESGCGWYDDRGRMVEPTYWMPRPPLPADRSESGASDTATPRAAGTCR